MCDCSTSGISISRGSRRSWIIFKEEKTDHVCTNSVEAGVETSTSVPDGPSQSDPNLDNMYLLLEESLRPATPDFEDPNSVALFEEHKQLAQEYLKVQTEVVYLNHKKHQLLAAELEKQQRRKEHLKQLQNERDSLLSVRELLLQQKERSGRNNSRPTSGDGWVIVPRNAN